MNHRDFFRGALAASLACALSMPALAQTTSSTVTTTTGGQASAAIDLSHGNTRVSGSTGEGTVSSSGVVVDAGADAALLSQVATALASDRSIEGATIDVQVVGGRVTLNGTARDMAQVEAAKEIARGVAGDANVVSNLTSGAS